MKITIAYKFFQKGSLISCTTILLILLLAGIAGAETQINSCTVISSPGAYVLSQTIANSVNNTCIKITSSDVIFDGAGYTIDGNDSSNTIGVYVNNLSSGLRNVTVKNVIVTDWNTGIYYNNAPNGSVTNINANSNLDAGIRISLSSSTNLTNNIANSNSQGIYLESSSNGSHKSNSVNSNYYGFRLSSSNGNVFNNSTVNLNSYGFFLSSSIGNIFNKNTINSNSNGLYFSSSNNNTMANNTISLNNYGLQLLSSSNNKIYNNKFNNNNNINVNTFGNTWNTTKTAGENIMGGPYLGGNYWANPSGTGFSTLCADADGDGLCDTTYNIASGNSDPMALSAVGQGTGQSIIESCSIISLPGSYILNNSILNIGNNTCIRIVSSDVIFDGASYTIDGMDSSNTIGVYVNNPYSGLRNVTVKNVIVTDWNTGIYYDSAPNGTISNNNADSNLDAGIRISLSSSTNLTNNIANSNSQGIYLESSSNGLHDGNSANSNTYYGFRLSSSNGNVFNNSTVNLNYYGFFLSSSIGNVLNKNTINSNSNGLYFSSSNNNTITKNTISLNNWGVQLLSSSNNKIYNNKFNNINNINVNTFGNTWNTTKTSGENIIGGPYLGGNYWTNPSGTGFSDLCADADGDGLCDTIYNIASGNIDPMALSAVGQGTGQSIIESCSIISLPGSYILNNSIVNSGNNTCIRIVSSDVIFDGSGYTIDGIDSSNTIGVYVTNPYSGLRNVTVKNVIVTDWNTGIYYDSAPNGTISNNNADSNLDAGIRISLSSSTNLTNNIANSNSQGIYLESSSNGLHDGNTANSNTYYGFRLSSSSGNVFNNSTVNLNYYGFFLSSSIGNIFNKNTINSNSNGFYFSSSNNNTMANNTISLNNYGLQLLSSANNKIYNNKFNNINNINVNTFGNTWNTTKTAGENIIGGPYLGGNYWANPSGTGFSETCIDADREGFCDSSYNIASGNIDQLALKYIVSEMGQPDLTISNVTMTPMNFIDGEVVTFNAVLENIGMGNTTRGFITRFLVDNVSMGDQYTFGINSGSTETVSQNWVAAPGEHKLKVLVDFVNVITETNDNNNTFEINLTRVEKSDLIVSDITWTPSDFSDGTLLTFNAIIENIGTGNTRRGFATRFYIDGVSIGDKSTSGETLGTASVTLTWITTPGQHKIKVMADVSNSISESDENNNTLELNLTKIEPADLIVSNITWTPLSFSDGQAVTFNASIKNIGKGNTSKTFYTGFLIDGNSIGTKSYSGGINTGNFVTISQTWAATPGNHTIRAQADSYDQIKESDETNNTLELNLTKVDQPDLTVSSLTWSPSNFSDGQTVKFNAVVANIGVGNTTRVFHTRFFIDGSNIGDQSLSGLASGASSSVAQTWTATPGEHNISASVDIYNSVAESNEGNNIFLLNLTKVDQPDLTVSVLTWSPSNFSDGQTVTFNAVVANIGAGNTTRSFYTRFLMDDIQIGEKYISGLNSGSTATVNQVWPAGPGTHTIKVFVDSHNNVAESNKSNNIYLATLPEVGMADLTISNLTWSPSDFSDGQTVTFTATIKNIGDNTTRQFYTRFLIDGSCPGNVLISGLASGESKNISTVWSASAGDHIVNVTADPDGYIIDSNKSNNNISNPLPSVLIPDLVPYFQRRHKNQ